MGVGDGKGDGDGDTDGDGVGVAIGVTVGAGVAVGESTGVGVGDGVVPPHPGIALQTFRRPPVMVRPAKLGSRSTLLSILLFSADTVKEPWRGADKISAAAPTT